VLKSFQHLINVFLTKYKVWKLTDFSARLWFMFLLSNFLNIIFFCVNCFPWLAWFYKEDRGAHVYWLQKGTVDARPDHILNLIHYEVCGILLFYLIYQKCEQESIIWKKIISLYLLVITRNHKSCWNHITQLTESSFWFDAQGQPFLALNWYVCKCSYGVHLSPWIVM
jgi:hypothetical protein